jgi:thioredoxin-like negative regulator of GroEL
VTEVAFGRINVAEAPEIAETFDVEAVPTLLVFRDGQLHGRLDGAEQIQTFVDEVEEEIGSG